MLKTRVRWAVLIVIGVAAASLLIWLFRPIQVDVDTALVVRGPIADVVSDQGTARVRQAYIVSSPVNGRIERLPVEVGDRVAANETVVARVRPAAPEFLDSRTHAQAESAVAASRAALAASSAQRDRAAADVARAESAIKRVSELAREGIATPQELDNARADADAAAHALRAGEADIEARRANLRSAEMQLRNPLAPAGQTVAVTSPTSGIVSRLLQQSERTVAVGTQLVEVADTSGLEAAIEFLTQDAVRIAAGQRAEIYNWGGSADLPAVVRRVEPQGFTKVSALGVEEQRTLVYLAFAGTSDNWRGLAPGYRVWGRVYLREASSVVLLPVGALVRDAGHWAAYRVEQTTARLRPVEIGTMNDQFAEVRSNLEAGDRVILYPSDQVRDGVNVRLRP